MQRKSRSNVSLTRNSIIESIQKSESKGSRVNDIIKDTGLGRSTLERYLRKLEDDFIIEKKNKQAPYYLTQKIYGDPKSQSFLLQCEAFRHLGDLKWLSNKSKFLNPKIYYRLFNDPKHKKDQEIMDQLSFLQFANRLSSIILYTLLQAVRPSRVSDKLDKDRAEAKGKKRDNIARTWIESVNSTSLINSQLIFKEFSKLDLVKGGRAIHNLNLDPEKVPGNISNTKSSIDEDKAREAMYGNILQTFDEDQQKTFEQNPDVKKDFSKSIKENIQKTRLYSPNSPEWSLYEIDEDNFERLSRAYASLYPDIYRDLERIREGLPNKIKGIRESRLHSTL